MAGASSHRVVRVAGDSPVDVALVALLVGEWRSVGVGLGGVEPVLGTLDEREVAAMRKRIIDSVQIETGGTLRG